MKPPCVNCGAESTVLWNPPHITAVVYCDGCIPHWYRNRVASGEFGPPPDLPGEEDGEEDV